MVVVIVLFLFLSIVGGSVCSLLSVTHSSGLSHINSTKAFYVAQAGLQWALKNRAVGQCEVSFGEGNFSFVEKNMWRYEVRGSLGEAVRHVRGYRTIEYFPGTREWVPKENVHFLVQNQTGYWIDFNGMKLEWSGREAYFEKIHITEEGDDELITVWDGNWYGGQHVGSGEKVYFYLNRDVAPSETLEIVIEGFESGKHGGNKVDMRDLPVKVTFYDYAYPYQFTVVGACES